MQTVPTSPAEDGIVSLDGGVMWRVIPWLIVAAVGVFCACLLVVPIEAIFARVPLTYNEGWNALHTQRLMSGGPLYPPIAANIFVNYPPLSFYVVGLLGKAMGDYIFAGRVLALLSLFVVTANVGFIARALGAAPLLSILASLIFLAFVSMFYADYVAADDPQWFGHALQTSGLALLLCRPPLPTLTTSRLLGAALLLAAGGLVKQDLLALPLAISIWLLLVDRGAFLHWLAICAAILVVALATLVLLYGWNFVVQVLAAERNFSTKTLANILQVYTMRLLVYFAFASAAIVVGRADRRIWLLGIYLALATVLGLAMTTAVGVVYSALFDATIAMMIGAAVAMQWATGLLTELRATHRLSATIAALLFILPLRGVLPAAFDYSHALSRSLEAAPQWDASISRIAQARGPVACEYLSLCYWAGRPSSIDFFNFGQYVVRHPAFGAPVIAAIAGHKLVLIQMENAGGSIRFSPVLNDLLAANYQADQTLPMALLTPRP